MSNRTKRTFDVHVTQTIEIELDLTKFTHEVQKSFNVVLHKASGIEAHAKYIAELAARGLISGPHDFIEGYGRGKEIGISINNSYIAETNLMEHE